MLIEAAIMVIVTMAICVFSALLRLFFPPFSRKDFTPRITNAICFTPDAKLI